jgi:hypothetical protein
VADRVTVAARMDPIALARLDALAAKFGVSRTAVIHLALARLAEVEGIKDEMLGGVAA